MDTAQQTFLVLGEVARELRVSPRTISNALSRRRRGLPAGPLGSLPVLRIGRRLLVDAAAFEEWLAAHLKPAAEPAAARARLEVVS